MATTEKVTLNQVYQIIREKRLAMGISNEVMAGHLAISLSSYKNIEKGLTVLSMERFIHMAEIFGQHPADLLSSVKTSPLHVES